MQYALLIYETEQELARRGVVGEHDDYMAPYQAYVARLREAGILRGGHALKRPATATTVAVVKGERHLQDGPVAHSHEQLGGVLVIEVDDLDAALDWAARCPCAETGRVEVRPTGVEQVT